MAGQDSESENRPFSKAVKAAQDLMSNLQSDFEHGRDKIITDLKKDALTNGANVEMYAARLTRFIEDIYDRADLMYDGKRDGKIYMADFLTNQVMNPSYEAAVHRTFNNNRENYLELVAGAANIYRQISGKALIKAADLDHNIKTNPDTAIAYLKTELKGSIETALGNSAETNIPKFPTREETYALVRNMDKDGNGIINRKDFEIESPRGLPGGKGSNANIPSAGTPRS